MKPWKQILFLLLVVLTILSLLLSACGPIDKHGNQNNGKDKDKNKDKVKDNGNKNETNTETDVNANKITICHKTGSAKHPYVEITISNNAIRDGHAKHQGDIIPAPEGGCPTVAAATGTPYP